MNRRKLFVFLTAMAVLLTAVFFTSLGVRHLGAAPTLADVVLTNIAQVDWNSGATAFSTNARSLSAGVGTNYGATWIGDPSTTVVGGNYVYNDTFLTNDGNASADFVLSYISNFANANSKIWTNWFSNVTDGGARGATIVASISPAGAKNIRFFVYAPGDETNGAYMTYNCLASNSNAAADLGASATHYTGLNGVVYGGNMGRWNAMPSVTFVTNGEADFTNWRVTVQVAEMVVAKSAAIQNTGPFAGNTTVPFPGARITYRVGYTNQGGISATAVRIVDTLPTNYVVYVNDSIERGAADSTLAQYGTLTARTDDEGDDDASTNSAAREQVVFTPTAGTAPGTGGTVVSTGAGAYYFQVYLQ